VTIEGDGIGPELISAALEVLAAVQSSEANLGVGTPYVEPVHGSAPSLAGTDRAKIDPL